MALLPTSTSNLVFLLSPLSSCCYMLSSPSSKNKLFTSFLSNFGSVVAGSRTAPQVIAYDAPHSAMEANTANNFRCIEQC